MPLLADFQDECIPVKSFEKAADVVVKLAELSAGVGTLQ